MLARRIGGFSLIEVMLAALLGVLVTAALAELFASNSRSYRMLTGQARMQESARHAFHFLGRAVRAAGYPGCAVAGGALPGAVTGFDSVPRRFTGLDGFRWRQMQPGSDVVVFLRAPEASAGGLCSRVAATRRDSYFVAEGTGTNDRGERIWSLWRRTSRRADRSDDRSSQLVAGIEDLQVLYGIDSTPGDGSGPERYVAAPDVGASVVKALRITITASSVDAVSAQGGDREDLLRATFSQTIAVRNP